jgi:hypothetical protein
MVQPSFNQGSTNVAWSNLAPTLLQPCFNLASTLLQPRERHYGLDNEGLSLSSFVKQNMFTFGNNKI